MGPSDITAVLLAVGLAVAALEHLYGINEYRSGGWFDWSVLRSSNAYRIRQPFTLIDRVFSDKLAVHAIVVTQCTLALLLAAPLEDVVRGVVLCTAGVVGCVMAMRMPMAVMVRTRSLSSYVSVWGRCLSAITTRSAVLVLGSLLFNCYCRMLSQASRHFQGAVGALAIACSRFSGRRHTVIKRCIVGWHTAPCYRFACRGRSSCSRSVHQRC
jgi:hypothetical protein